MACFQQLDKLISLLRSSRIKQWNLRGEQCLQWEEISLVCSLVTNSPPTQVFNLTTSKLSSIIDQNSYSYWRFKVHFSSSTHTILLAKWQNLYLFNQCYNVTYWHLKLPWLHTDLKSVNCKYNLKDRGAQSMHLLILRWLESTKWRHGDGTDDIKLNCPCFHPADQARPKHS